MSIQIFTDGSCLGNPGVGGWAYLVLQNDKKSVVCKSGGNKDTTNNRMELLAIIKAFCWVQKNMESLDTVKVYSDSIYVVNGINKWLDNWVKKDWKKVKNRDLWERVYAFKQDSFFTKIEVSHVRGHSGIENNNIVDRLARNEAMKLKSEIFPFD